MKKLLFLTLLFLFTAASVYADQLQDSANKLFKPIPTKFVDFQGNPSNRYKVLLGRMLYFEPRISKSQMISCNTCHNAGAGFVDNQQTSTGHFWQQVDVNTPTILNSVFNISQFWDGRSKDLMEQAQGPLLEADEMAATPDYIVEVLKSMPEYVAIFARAFPESKEDPVTFDNVARAIEVFEATIITPNSAFDRFLKGDVRALNAEQRAGLEIFINKGCATCHGGVNMGGAGYSNVSKYSKAIADGATPDKRDYFSTTKYEDNPLLLKVPSLRNIEWTSPYFRLGNEPSLLKAINHIGDANISTPLTEAEAESIHKFLQTTTGNMPIITYPQLPKTTDKTPKADLTK